MNLIDIIDNTKTDKNTTHSYILLYEDLLNKKKETAKNILEIGIDRGGSIKLWSEYFTNATIYGLDIMDINNVWDGIKNKNNIILYTSLNAYDPIFVNNTFVNKIKFDFMLDDGPHTLESMINFIELYSPLMADDGILIIEDVQSLNWLDNLKNAVPEHLKDYIKTYDLIKNKNRYDDIVFTIDKS
jgi:cephalosporin hydroxylase